MKGSEFLSAYDGASARAWEAAALEIARQGGLTPWPWIDLHLTDGQGHIATLKVQADVLSIGPIDDHVRLPLTPGAAQAILNLQGWLLPTPWLAYQIWRTAVTKLEPTPMVPNKGANLPQYAEHSRLIDQQIQQARPSIGDLVAAAPDLARLGAQASSDDGALQVLTDALLERGILDVDRRMVGLVAGHKKDIVVANFAKPGKVLLFGWWRPSPPAADVFDDGRPMGTPGRQPIQPKSNVHGDFYVDYSHGVRAIAPEAIVDGRPMATVDLYQHPTLSRLVSNEGPVRVPRYPSPVPPPARQSAHVANLPGAFAVALTTPGAAELGFDAFSGRRVLWYRALRRV